MSNTVIVIGGPTASGKSGLALRLAEERGGTIINADSLQLYAGLPILTAQPDAAAIARAPHRLYGTLPQDIAANAALWCSWSDAEIAAALAAGSLPIIVGGTGLYLEALMRGLSAIPPVPSTVRERARCEFDAMGREAFRDRLIAADPDSARLKTGDTQRLLRAWEVFVATGRPLIHWQSSPVDRPPRDWRRIAILPPREALYRACNERFLAMLAGGAAAEVRRFRPEHSSDAPLTRALGYRHICAWQDGALPEGEMIERSQADTRHYAKRQTTWFRNRFSALGDATVIGSADAFTGF